MSPSFNRRIYTFPAFKADVLQIFDHIDDLRQASRSGRVSRAFAEKIMLVVTSVNGCRYCSYGHSLAALHAGVPQEQIDELSAGLIPSGAPGEELPALLYARRWAECDAHPEHQATAQLAEIYGDEKAEAIQALLRMIRIGNLLGNQGDHILFKLSFGRVGLREDEARWSHQAR